MIRPSRIRMRLVSLRLVVPVLVTMLLVPAAPVAVQAKEDSGLRRRGTPEPLDLKRDRRQAIRRGCDFLCGTPGSVPESPRYGGKQRPDGGFGDNRAVVALTSLATLALMADGSTDGRGRHGKAVRRGVTFLLKLIETPKPGNRYPEGYFWYPQDGTSRMHGQGFATLALATALGTSDRKRALRIRRALIKAVACIEGAQTTTGGFGYQPEASTDHEGSVTVAVAQGLRAARDAGIVVSQETINKGLNYLRQSQKKDGSFQYSLHQDQSSYALTAAALSSFFLYGQYKEDPNLTIKRAITFLRAKLKSHTEVAWYYYAHFYAAWAAWQWDGHTWANTGKNLWGWWHKRVYRDLMRRQTRKGSFETDSGRYDYGPVLSTSFAILTLAIPDEVIPIFQR